MNAARTPDLQFDFLALGEAVIDLISGEAVAHLQEAAHFERFAGGQVANLAMNMARLGNRVALSACLGQDGFGQLLLQQIAAVGVATDFIQISTKAPTTMIPVTRTPNGTPEFVIYRGADALLQAEDRLFQAVARSKILHTSAFALSRDPARSTIFQAMQIARENNHLVSLDPNYHPRIWPDTADFIDVLKDAFGYVSVTKPSIEDCARLFGEGMAVEDYAAQFLRFGTEVVVISQGSKGVFLATQAGDQYQIIPHRVTAVDVTGAGDAFWSGLLTALLDGRSALEGACAGQIVAEIKICTVGPLSQALDRIAIYTQAQTVEYRQL